ncbi:AraC family transcriptional regulator [Clostridiaceae bacterium M8S5]|nr:AraC family transcriptional regulator [Clostridiaceae bacterium M8S5]
MHKWREMVQAMINWIEVNIDEKSPLMKLSEAIGYSPYYCSSQFHRITGLTIRDYITARRVSLAAIELRDTNERIIDIAMKYGFSSQEAFTRAFVKKFGITPNKYRIDPKPIPLFLISEVYKPIHYNVINKINRYKENILEIRIENISKHKFIGVWDKDSIDYIDFFMKEKHCCDEICGNIESMSNHTLKNQLTHTAGWFREGEVLGYFYGIPVPYDYEGDIPKDMQCKVVGQSDYIVFYHPPFNYIKENSQVVERVDSIAWTFNPHILGYEWDEEQLIYQRHYPEGYGYAVLRPVKKKVIDWDKNV